MRARVGKRVRCPCVYNCTCVFLLVAGTSCHIVCTYLACPTVNITLATPLVPGCVNAKMRNPAHLHETTPSKSLAALVHFFSKYKLSISNTHCCLVQLPSLIIHWNFITLSCSSYKLVIATISKSLEHDQN